jgi:basic membrane protein A and related proteins
MRPISRLLFVLLLTLATMLLVACPGAEPAPATPAEEPAPAPAPAEPAPAEEPAPAAEEAEPFRVGFVYVSPIGDLGWTWSHDQGRLALEQHFGDGIQTTYVENVPEGAEATRTIRDLAQRGNDLIITTSFGYMDPTAEVAQEYPDTWFVHVSGYRTADNLSTIFGRMYRMRYLSGLVAGSATESNIIGYVAAFPIPEVVRGMNAFTLGVRAANPDAEVRVVYTNTWFGPPQEREAAQALLDQGADVIAQHQDTTEPQQAAAEAGAVSIGYNSDMRAIAGDTVLTSPIWNWGVKYIEIVEQIMDGTYQSESYWGPEVVDLAPFSPEVDARVVDMVEAQRTAIEGGEADVFCGPINSNTGVLVVAEGNCLTDGEMLEMQWYVEGVAGEAPEAAQEGLGEASDMIGPAAATE